MLTDEQIARAVVALESLGLDALWLFGSEASGRATPTSDVDFAALFRSPVRIEELLDARAAIAATLGREVDLVDLARASPILAVQVLNNGRLVSDHAPARRLRFETFLPSRFEDLRILRAPIERRIVDRLANGRT